MTSFWFGFAIGAVIVALAGGLWHLVCLWCHACRLVEQKHWMEE